MSNNSHEKSPSSYHINSKVDELIKSMGDGFPILANLLNGARQEQVSYKQAKNNFDPESIQRKIVSFLVDKRVHPQKKTRQKISLWTGIPTSGKTTITEELEVFAQEHASELEPEVRRLEYDGLWHSVRDMLKNPYQPMNFQEWVFVNLLILTQIYNPTLFGCWMQSMETLSQRYGEFSDHFRDNHDRYPNTTLYLANTVNKVMRPNEIVIVEVPAAAPEPVPVFDDKENPLTNPNTGEVMFQPAQDRGNMSVQTLAYFEAQERHLRIPSVQAAVTEPDPETVYRSIEDRVWAQELHAKILRGELPLDKNALQAGKRFFTKRGYHESHFKSTDTFMAFLNQLTQSAPRFFIDKIIKEKQYLANKWRDEDPFLRNIHIQEIIDLLPESFKRRDYSGGVTRAAVGSWIAHDEYLMSKSGFLTWMIAVNEHLASYRR